MKAVDPKIEKPTREMIGHALRGELQDLAVLIQATGGEAYRQVIGLCLIASAYITTDVCQRVPTDADTREIARRVADEKSPYELNEDDVQAYLADAALGNKPLAEALGDDEKAAALPVLITASLLFRFRPQGQDQWDYLDQIWNATETAENLPDPVLPAAELRLHRARLAKQQEKA